MLCRPSGAYFLRVCSAGQVLRGVQVDAAYLWSTTFHSCRAFQAKSIRGGSRQDSI